MPTTRHPKGTPGSKGGKFAPGGHAEEVPVTSTALKLSGNDQPSHWVDKVAVTHICGLKFRSNASKSENLSHRERIAALAAASTGDSEDSVNGTLVNYARLFGRENTRRGIDVRVQPSAPRVVASALALKGWTQHSTLADGQWYLCKGGLPPGLTNAMLCVESQYAGKQWVALRDGEIHTNSALWGVGDDLNYPLEIAHAMVAPTGNPAQFDEWSKLHNSESVDPRPVGHRQTIPQKDTPEQAPEKTHTAASPVA